MEFVLLGLLALALPVMAIVAFILVLAHGGRLNKIENQLRELQQRLGMEPLTPRPPMTPAQTAAAARPAAVREMPAAEAPPVSASATETPPPAQPVSSQPHPAAPAPRQARPPRPPVPPRSQSDVSFEERFGTRWVVWVGGLALALGGIFLVRYSIEAGLIGPAARIFLGALFAAALVAAGEWQRRKESNAKAAAFAAANIPAILTAAGTAVAYATVYAAYALYGFLVPANAFILLGIVALGTLAAALLHGPMLAGLGLIGAYVAPMLVSTAAPNYWALYIYLAIVTAAAFALARIRLWRWLAIAAVAFGVFWMLPGIGFAAYVAPHIFHGVAGFALAGALIVSGLLYGPPAQPGKVDAISSVSIAAYVFALALLVLARNHEDAALYAFAVLCALTLLVAWQAESALGAVPLAAIMASGVIALWSVQLSFSPGFVTQGVSGVGDANEMPKALYGSHLWLGGTLALLFGGFGFVAQARTRSTLQAVLWAAGAVIAPVGILAALYYRIAHFQLSYQFAAVAMALAALYAFATEVLAKREQPGASSAAAAFATGSIVSLALGLTFALEKGWLTVALALMTAGIAWIADKRNFPFLRWLAAGACILVAARVAWDPRIAGSDLGTTPVFNWLLWGYGVPALAYWAAGWLLRKRADDFPARMADSLAILFTVLFFSLQIRHYINGGDLYRYTAPLAELALNVCVGLGMAIGLERLRMVTKSIVHDLGAQIIAVFTLIGIVVGLLFVDNPYFTGDSVGTGRFFNLVLLGYLLPAILAGALAITYQRTRNETFRNVAAITSIVLALAYLTLQVRALFQGPVLSGPAMSDAEGYTYSAVWLAFAVLLLLIGIVRQSKAVRLASAAVMLLTIAKVFLIDMAGLTGVWRAFSFIGLGAVLVGIGLLYQRLLFPKKPISPAQTES